MTVRTFNPIVIVEDFSLTTNQSIYNASVKKASY